MKRYFQMYLIMCAVVALIFQIFVISKGEFGIDIRLIIFLVLLLQNANTQVKSREASFSVTYPLLFPVIVFYGPGWASIMASIGLISMDEFDTNSWPVFCFNRGSLGLAAGASGVAFHHIGGYDNFVFAVFVASFLYCLVNLSLFVIARQLQDPGSSSFSTVWETQKTIIPSAALAVFFSYAFQQFDIFGVIGAYYVFMAIRSGALFGHLEMSYRISLTKALLRAVYAKDQDLMLHLENVALYSKKLAKNCRYPRWKLQLLEEASYFHDIGKLEISDVILKKPTKLTDGEYAEMKGHPTKGMQFLQEVPLPRSHKDIVANIAKYHHERYDGKGYPEGLAGEAIPLEARIVAIADTWDAMVGNRCYRQPLSYAEALAELRRVQGTQLDPHLVDVYIRIIKHDWPELVLSSQTVQA